MNRLLNLLSLSIASLFMGSALLLPVSVGAVEVLDPVCQNNPSATVCKDNSKNQEINDNSLFGPNGVLTKVARLIAIVVGVAAVIMIIVSGIQYVFSSGDPARLNKAKDTLLFALVGLVVAMMSQAIIAFVLNKL